MTGFAVWRSRGQRQFSGTKYNITDKELSNLEELLLMLSVISIKEPSSCFILTASFEAVHHTYIHMYM